MKQLVQNLDTGLTELIDSPYPQCRSGEVLIETKASLISIGTERMLVQFGKSGIMEKIRQQPDKVKQVFEKIKSDGLLPTVHAVRNKLAEPLPMGYCNAGVVVAKGNDVIDFSIGDRVVSNGPHAEIVAVPKNLVSKIPDEISFEEASFTVAGAIGLQGIRLAAPTLGETTVVIGLGLIGQLTAQLARAHGCRVIAFDLDEAKVNCARSMGIDARVSKTSVAEVLDATGNIGADLVLIAASSSSETVLTQAAQMSRKRGKIILIGVIPITVNRSELYEKELSFQVSCSYGPGRYDPIYEQSGNDYPLPFVRWTERRNFEAVLECLKSGSLKVTPLISQVEDFYNVPSVYQNLESSKALAIILTYKNVVSNNVTVDIKSPKNLNIRNNNSDRSLSAIIGAGNFAKAAMIPGLIKAGIPVKYVCSKGGLSGTILARKFNIPNSTTDIEQILNDNDVKTVFIATRHDSHAFLCEKALKSGKHVFVEKPLAVSMTQLERVVQVLDEQHTIDKDISITVGFNRRFSPFIKKLINALGSPVPMINAVFTMNAGALPSKHWTQSAEEGGGRVIGEACHLIDLFSFIAGSPIKKVCATNLGSSTNLLSDNVSILLKCENGSQGVVNYFSNGSKAYPKETLEIYTNNQTVKIDNFKKISFFGFSNARNMSSLSQDKGHNQQFIEYSKFLKNGGAEPVPFSAAVNATAASIAAVQSLENQSWVDVLY